ncbi:hypothetical protein Rhal01_02792 [Rubritalea halochordaticola]|uniref:exo-alpha-sialidase n=1 Tax=Rubritalea halochordaticola TaxID=714537 RepID=A0ABP9V5H5_9BACT
MSLIHKITTFAGLILLSAGFATAQSSPPGTPVAWYKSDQGLVTDGTNITSWEDQVGSKHLDRVIGTPTFLTQSTASSEAPVLRFDGNDSLWIASSSLSYTGDRTIVVYARINDTNDGFLFDGSSNAGLSRAQIRSNQWQAGIQASGNGDSADTVTGSVTTGQWQTHTFVFDQWWNSGNTSNDHTVYHYINGTLEHQYDTETNTGLAGLILAGNVAGQRNLNTDIAEVIVYDSALTSTQASDAHSYLSTKWGQPSDVAMSLASADTIQNSQMVLATQAATYLLVALELNTTGTLSPFNLTSIQFDLAGTTDLQNISAVKIFTGSNPDFSGTADAVITSGLDSTMSVDLSHTLSEGSNAIWVAVQTQTPLSTGNLIDGRILGYTITGPQAGSYSPVNTDPDGALTVGSGVYAHVLRKGGDDGSSSYRIPALVTTNAGTLIAGFDVRWNHSGDLPANVDTAIMRSTDGGITWGPMQIIMDFDANEPGSSGNGVGDPALLVDRVTGRIWCAALWSFGNNGWAGSGPGFSAEDTGQYMLNYSDDDGLTWSTPQSITASIKDSSWNLYFQGPGKGICTRDGVLVFPSQYRDSSGVPRSNFIYSTDQGTTWHTAAPAIPSGSPWTTEAQIVELDSGDLLISMRNHDGRKERLWCTYSWDHETETIADGSWGTPWFDQNCPTVMASVQRHSSTLDGHPYSVILFSNPDNPSARSKMTIRASINEGQSWDYSRKIDDRPAAYSCMTTLPNGDIGILYETGDSSSIATLTFMRFPLSWLVGDTDSDEDGIPDFYEDTNGLDKNNAADATEDADQDGQNNHAEYLASTNAQDASSQLAMKQLNKTDSGLQLQWKSVPNKIYTLEHSSSLQQGSWLPVPGMENIRSNSVLSSLEIPQDNTPQGFYRIRAN